MRHPLTRVISPGPGEAEYGPAVVSWAETLGGDRLSGTTMDRETSSITRRRPATPPLSEAKLLAPRLRRELVSRPRLNRTLDAGSEARVVLVAAPPGYGKTTAVSSWCAERRGALAWVGLDPGDNDQTRLWSYIAMAVERVRTGLGAPALRRLGIASGGVEDVVVELMNGLVGFGSEVTLVLDDFHHIVDKECLESIDRAIEELPPSVRLVIITRADPLFAIAKLRAGGDLAELRTDELAFRVPEARELLVERGGLELDDGDLEALCDRTDGWPGALYLALLWLRSVDDPSAAVRGFGAQHRFVADYLNQEVFESLGADERWFLSHASVVRRFTAPLCDHLRQERLGGRAGTARAAQPARRPARTK
jgi:LuxR family transcriptional regulator, maltose regulon positive regulatory protein